MTAAAEQKILESEGTGHGLNGDDRPRAPELAAVVRQLSSFNGKRVAVAMSGGVDSAVAGLLLKRAGAEVIGLSLRLHDADPYNPLAPRACCAPDDLADARRLEAAKKKGPVFTIPEFDEGEKEVIWPGDARERTYASC